MLKIYGIRNCDTVRKALKWAEEQGLEFTFHDYRKDPLSPETVEKWLSAIDRSKLVNKRGTTYRNLDDAAKAQLEGEGALPLLLEQPTLMKRPLFDTGRGYVVGFTDAERAVLLG
ncbi:arsenate reductase [Sneathiella chinensis]|nr:arsenate reductase [Sneathiella chinensis]